MQIDSQTPRLVPVDAERHGNRFWRRPAHHRHAASVVHVPIVLPEMVEVASLFPVAFDLRGDSPCAVAVLRPDTDAPHPWMDADSGIWRAPYMPAALRAYPFNAAPAGKGQLALLVDEGSGLLTGTPDAEPFFTPDGYLSPALRAVITFLQERHAALRATAAAVAALQEADVLVPLQPTGRFSAAQGLSRVDPARLEALDDATTLKLARLRALALAHAHLVSLQHGPRSMAAVVPSATPQGGEASPEPAPLGGFLDAMARAPRDEDIDFAALAESST